MCERESERNRMVETEREKRDGYEECVSVGGRARWRARWRFRGIESSALTLIFKRATEHTLGICTQ